MAAAPLTLTFGAWAPDLANNALVVGFDSEGEVTVPLVNVQNITYVDANYYATPSSVAFAPPADGQVVTAFTWYDPSAAQQNLFAGETGSVERYVEGTWVETPFVSFQSVSVVGHGMRLSQGGLAEGMPHFLKLSIGAITVVTHTFTVTVTFGAWNPLGFPATQAQGSATATPSGGTPTGYAWTITSTGGSATGSALTSQTCSIVADLEDVVTATCTVTVAAGSATAHATSTANP